ncbi:MAG TPA: serine hydrolase domain-containing protein, partial [Pyrinomonadaceae bacterium]|nr:serine hydrolase domain-containing protein [Pyrinomonadaceae bacterium]
SVYSPFLLALVIEQASGSSFEKFLHEALFAPAGMTDTELEQRMTVDAPLRSKAFDAGGNRDYFPLRVTLPLVYTNATDLFSWARTLRKGDLIQERELSRLATPLADRLDIHGYTEQQTIFGNVRRENGAVVTIRHQGGHSHFNSLLFIDLKSNVTVVVLTNHAAEGELYRVADKVYALATEPATNAANPP